MSRPLVIGHRGAPGHRPEHTASSYRFALEAGVDAVEPDVVVSRDGVLVVRHENEIGGTTDVAQHPEFSSRRTTRIVDARAVSGWFAEDFTWAELSTLRCRERVPHLRPESAAFDGEEPMLRLADLIVLVREASAVRGRAIALVLELKHAAFFASAGWDLAALVDRELAEARATGALPPVIFESFEPAVLDRLRDRDVPGDRIYLLDDAGGPADGAGPAYAHTASPSGLDGLVGRFDGISVAKSVILAPDERGRATGPSRVVADAHARGLRVFTWTCRPENAFLLPGFRGGGGEGAFGDWAGEWAVLRDAQVDGVFVDHPDLGVPFFGG